MATYYVSTTGTDGGGHTGAIGDPFATFNYAGTRMAAGDTLFVRGGTYVEVVEGSNFPNGSNWTVGSGAIFVSNYASETVTIQPYGGGTAYGLNFYHQSYHIWTGINLDGINNDYNSGAGLLQITGGDHIRITDCTVANSYWSGVCTSDSGGLLTYLELLRVTSANGGRVGGTGGSAASHAFYLAASFSGSPVTTDRHWLVDGCIASGYTALSYDGGFTVSNSGSIDTLNGITIRNSLAYGNGVGAQLDGATTIPIVFYNNTIVGNVYDGVWVYADSNAAMYNNTIHSNGGWGIQIGGGYQVCHPVLKNNSISNNTSGPVVILNTIGTHSATISYTNNNGNGNSNAILDQNSLSTITNTTTVAPGYTDAALGDFSLLSSSALRDIGTTVALVGSDQIGVARPQGAAYDIGAFEYASGGGGGAPPGNLRYVSTAGSDSTGDGSIAAPWRTFNFSGTQLVAGQTLYARGGTYAEEVSGANFPNGTDWTTGSGAITVQAYPGETVTIQPASGSTAVLQLFSKSYHIWDGIHLDGRNMSANASNLNMTTCDHVRIQNSTNDKAAWSGIRCGQASGLASYLEFFNLTITNANNVASVGNSASGMYFDCAAGNATGTDHHYLVDNCTISGVTRYADCAGVTIVGGANNDRLGGITIRNCRISANSLGILSGDATTVPNTFYNNSVYSNTGTGIQLSADSKERLYNNTIDGNGGWGILVGESGAVVDALITNNSISANTLGPMRIRSTSGTSKATINRNNCNGNGNGNAISDQNGLSTITNTTTVAPGYVNVVSANFRLAVGSAMRDIGATIVGVASDQIGVARPSGSAYDIGAFEYYVVAPPPGNFRYVSTTGSDSTGDGSFGAPWRTFNFSGTQLVAGQTLYARAGLYDEHVDGVNFPNGTNWTTGSGAITVANYPGEAVWLQPTSGGTAPLLLASKSFHIWDGIHIDGHFLTGAIANLEITTCDHLRIINSNNYKSPWTGVSVGQAAGLSSFIELINLSINPGHQTSTGGTVGHGIDFSCAAGNATGTDHHYLVDGCYINGFTQLAGDAGIQILGGANNDRLGGITIRNCVITGNSLGVLAGDATTVPNVLMNNTINSNTGAGITLTADSKERIYNNTIDGNGGWGILVGSTGAVVDALITNNSISSNVLGPIKIQNTSGSSKATIDRTNNNGNGNSNAILDQNGLSTITNTTTVAPGYVNQVSGNFSLLVTSALRDIGTTIAAVTTDQIGVHRPSGAAYDIGAFEYPVAIPALSGSKKAYLQARYGIARYGATRYGYFTPNQVVTIAGVDRSALITKGSVGITLNTNDVPDTARFTVNPITGSLSLVPTEDQPVVIAIGAAGNPLFTGYITNVTHRRTPPGLQRPFYDVECTDDTRALDGHLVTGAWANIDAGALVITVLQRFAPSFTFLSVQQGIQTIATFSALNEKVSSVIRRVATLIGGGCYWRRKDVHLFGPAGESGYRAPTPPRTLTDTLGTLIAPPLGDVPWHAVDSSQKRTRVIVDAKRTTTPVSTPGGATSTVVAAFATVDYLIVAGGGAGGTSPFSGGGGGGGGVLSGTLPFNPGAYAVVVGAGGTTVGVNGENSSISTLVAVGGGAGGGTVTPGHASGNAGGCGGGGTEVSAAGGAGTAGQGYAGGAGVATGEAAGGGGGAGAAGGNAGDVSVGGVGGPGFLSSISGSPTYYGGGGGGNGRLASQPGGVGGGGTGGAGGNPGSRGATNTGGGGGGSADNSNTRQAGGSGLVIVRYPTGQVTATGGTITAAGGYTIHTFTSNGTFTVSTITIVAPVPVVTDLPLDDASQLDPNGGTVRIGNVVTPYAFTLGPTVSATTTNQPGSTLSADVAVGATSLPVTDVTQFQDSHGWVKCGEQYIRWDSKSGSALTGIAAAGFGAVNAALKSGTAVSWLGAIGFGAVGLVFDPPLDAGSPVIQRVIVDALFAQSALAQAMGGDGIIEATLDDDTLTVQSATQVATATLQLNANSNLLTSWTTFDLCAIAGVKQAINRTKPEPLTTSVLIMRVDISFPATHRLPVRRCQGELVRQPLLIDVFTVNPI